MKIRLLILLACCLSFSLAQATTTTMDPMSYAMGYQLGTNLQRAGFLLHPNSFMQGLQDGYAGKKPVVSAKNMRAAVEHLQQHLATTHHMEQKKMQTSQTQSTQATTEPQTTQNDFLAKNKNLPGIKTLPNGLQYEIIQAGTGKKPTANDTVTVDYEGKLVNGTIFDSSYQRGKPAQFKVNQVISGWTQALQMMKTGATWMLYIPSDLAYGQRSVGAIPANSVLIFKVHLIKVD